MEQKSTKRKPLKHHFRRKYKRYAAALAGAAILTGAALPGIPTSTAFAAEHPSKSPSSTSEYTKKADRPSYDQSKKVVAEKGRYTERDRHNDNNRHNDRNRPSGWGWHQHNNSWPGANENQGWYQDGKIYYRGDNSRYYTNYDRYRSNYAYYVSNPVDAVKSKAAAYGLNRYTDSFRLLTLTNNRAVVEVTKHDTGKLFNVILERSGDNGWKITSFRAL